MSQRLNVYKARPSRPHATHGNACHARGIPSPRGDVAARPGCDLLRPSHARDAFDGRHRVAAAGSPCTRQDHRAAAAPDADSRKDRRAARSAWRRRRARSTALKRRGAHGNAAHPDRATPSERNRTAQNVRMYPSGYTHAIALLTRAT